jgi:hypothetical protein
MSNFSHEAAATPLGPVLTGKAAATETLETALQQMLGRHSSDRAIRRTDPHNSQRRVNVA